VELVKLIIHSYNMTGQAGETAKILLLCKVYISFGITPALWCPVVKRILHQ